jgi:glycosyltransferase involved in cell wall biosynthesis
MLGVNDNPVVSICCSTYNHEKYIRQCIEGFLNQTTDFLFEIIIHDDASTDGTTEIIQEFYEKYPNLIKPIIQQENQYSKGIRVNYEYVFPIAKGKYIAFCEGDDYWSDPEKLQLQVNFLEENPQYSFVFTRFRTLSKGLILDDNNDKYFSGQNLIDYDLEKFEKGWHVGTQTLMFNAKSVNFEIHKEFKIFRDVHLFFYLLKNGKGACLSRFCAVYRIHENGIYSSSSNIERAETGLKCYQELYEKNREVKPLKNKYFKFLFFYAIALAENGEYLKSISVMIELFFKSFSVKYLFLYLRNFLKKSK